MIHKRSTALERSVEDLNRFQSQIFRKFFQEYDQSIKPFRSRSGPMERQPWPCKGYQQTTLGSKAIKRTTPLNPSESEMQALINP